MSDSSSEATFASSPGASGGGTSDPSTVESRLVGRLSTVSKFPYQPLGDTDSIRLLTLHPSHNLQRPVVCELFNTSLRDIKADAIQTSIASIVSADSPFDYSEGYTALSYTWGDANEVCPIQVNGFECWVTANLESALRHIRLENHPVRVWADAICINQHDVMERNHQVKQMGGIYSSAKSTVIYLGEETPEAARILTDDSFEGVTSNDIQVFFSRPWFTRVWVFQEAVLARDAWFYCGRQKTGWYDFKHKLRRGITSMDLSKVTLDPRIFFNHDLGCLGTTPLILEDFNLRPRKTNWDVEGPSFLEVLANRRGFVAGDPRDVVYALTGLFNTTPENTSAKPLVVDYNKSCAEVYNDTAAFLLSQSSNYDVLLYADGPQTSEGLDAKASWAPDWRFGAYYQDQLHHKFSGLRSMVCVSDDNTMDYALNLQLYTLYCRGYRPWEVVKYVSPVMNTLSRPCSIGGGDQEMSYLEDWYKGTLHEQTEKTYNIVRSQVGMHILPPYDDGTRPPRTGEKNWRLEQVDDTFDIRLKRPHFADAGHNRFQGRRFAVTRNGKLGLVSARARVGDIICRFTGARVPFVLRYRQDTSLALNQEIHAFFRNRIRHIRHCTFIGECSFESIFELTGVPYYEGGAADVCYAIH